METEDLTKIGLSESVKLIKNSKGYTWEIRLLSIDLERLEQINKDMRRKFEVLE